MNLKQIRVSISILVIMVFFLIFLGSKSVIGFPSEAVQFFQFIPSLIRFLQDPEIILGYGFLVVMVLGFIFGRIYCSFLCPLGILQDVFIYLSRRSGIRRKHISLPAFPKVRYAVLILTIISAGLGSLSLVNLLDPHSLFGRITDHIFKSLAISVNNIANGVLVSFDYYGLYTKTQHAMPPFLVWITLFFLSLIVVFSLLYGRTYCNTICPVGAMMGLIAQHSVLKFTIDRDRCRSCGVCEGVCKSGCMDVNLKNIDTSRCVACFNCLSVCKQSAIRYIRKPINQDDLQMAKRRFLVQSATLGSVVFGLFSPVRISFSSTLGTVPVPVTPPGSGSISTFSGTCTSCHLCVSVCKTHVLAPTWQGYGLSGILQPCLDFRIGHCEFSCNACGRVCPTGAILPLPLEAKQRVQIGTAYLDTSLCVVYNRNKHCGACGEACPTFAISPKGREHHFAPVIDTDYCIGCGACEMACPTKPKAIFVKANTVHAQAKVRAKRPFQKQKGILHENESFPF